MNGRFTDQTCVVVVQTVGAFKCVAGGLVVAAVYTFQLWVTDADCLRLVTVVKVNSVSSIHG